MNSLHHDTPNTVTCMDALTLLRGLADESIHCIVTSPPYFGLRNYGVEGQLGLEETPEAYVQALVGIFREARRVLRSDGTLWLNLGDSYVGGKGQSGSQGAENQEARNKNQQSLNRGYQTLGGKQQTKPTDNRAMLKASNVKPKDLLMMPARVALALQADGWYLRSDIIWAKPNPMPESVTDRPTKSHEHLFLLAKSATYYYDADAIAEAASHAGKVVRTNGNEGMSHGYDGNRTRDGFRRGITVADTRNKRDVWTIPTQPFTKWAKMSRRIDVALGDVSDGTTRIASIDCPLHGSLDQPGSIHVCDGREADALNHSLDTYTHPVQVRSADFAPIAQNHVLDLSEQNSGLLDQSNFPSAIDHSSENRKTDRAHETSPSYTPFVETPFRTDDTSNQRGSDVPESRIDGNSTSLSDEAGGHSQVQTVGGSVRILASEFSPVCTCKFYHEVTENTSHFAVMPEALVQPCILAGCPEGGIVLDFFMGSGTVARVAHRLGRQYLGCDINPAYVEMTNKSLGQMSLYEALP